MKVIAKVPFCAEAVEDIRKRNVAKCQVGSDGRVHWQQSVHAGEEAFGLGNLHHRQLIRDQHQCRLQSDPTLAEITQNR